MLLLNREITDTLHNIVANRQQLALAPHVGIELWTPQEEGLRKLQHGQGPPVNRLEKDNSLRNNHIALYN